MYENTVAHNSPLSTNPPTIFGLNKGIKDRMPSTKSGNGIEDANLSPKVLVLVSLDLEANLLAIVVGYLLLLGHLDHILPRLLQLIRRLNS